MPWLVCELLTVKTVKNYSYIFNPNLHSHGWICPPNFQRLLSPKNVWSEKKLTKISYYMKNVCWINVLGYVPLKKCHVMPALCLSVPDRRCRILKVVLVMLLVTWVLGIWRGEGQGKGGERGGQFTSNLRPRWTDPVTARRVPSKWKGIGKGSKRESARGVKKQGERACIL